MIEKVLERFENVVNSLGWDAIGGKENNDLYEWNIWLREMTMDDVDWTQLAEKQAEEAQRSREYGYVHPTVDDYDESLDDPNYEGVEEP